MQATLLDYPNPDYLSILTEELGQPTIVYFPCCFAAPLINNVQKHPQINHQHWRMEIVKDQQFNLNMVLNYDTIANVEPLTVGYLRDLLRWHTVTTVQMEIIHQPAVSKNRIYGSFRSDHRDQQTYTVISPISHEITVAVIDEDHQVKDIECAVGHTVIFDSGLIYSVRLNKENCYYTHTVIRIDDLSCNQRGISLVLDDHVLSDTETTDTKIKPKGVWQRKKNTAQKN
jgi:hypothetical protein